MPRSSEGLSPEGLRVVHCSDIHLDCDREHGESHRAALVQVMREAEHVDASLLLIAGDLFDSNQATTDTIEWAMQTLEGFRLPVVMIPGNHDCLEENAIFHRFNFDALSGVDMLSAPNGEVRSLPHLDVAIWGKGMVNHSHSFRPLVHMPERPSHARWFIGMGHGIYVPEGEDTGRSSPVHAEDIAASQCDYIALGHHHAALEVHGGDTAATYSGSPSDLIGKAATYTIIDFAVDALPSAQIVAMS